MPRAIDAPNLGEDYVRGVLDDEHNRVNCYMGVPVEKLTRDELMAAMIEGWNAYRRQLDDGVRSRRFLFDLMKGAR